MPSVVQEKVVRRFFDDCRRARQGEQVDRHSIQYSREVANRQIQYGTVEG